MHDLSVIVAGGLAMAGLAGVGGLTLILGRRRIERALLPLVAFAAGSLVGGALLHMLPAALAAGLGPVEAGALTIAGFTAFFVLELVLDYRHCRRADGRGVPPMTFLVLLGDAGHNFLGGLAIAGIYLVDPALGVTAWLAAAAHEVPQELGDFGVLVHGGWGPWRALAFNIGSGLTFLVGALVAYAAAGRVDIACLIPIAAGNFLYIGASDLVPEVRRPASGPDKLVALAAFCAGVGLLYAAARL